MKKALLGILLTAAAGLAGAMAGLLLFTIPLGLGVFLFQTGNLPWNNLLVGVLIWAAPTVGAAAGIALGWRALMREQSHEAERERRRGICDRCHYDLRGNTTNHCPECGKAIPAKQLKHLKQHD